MIIFIGCDVRVKPYCRRIFSPADRLIMCATIKGVTRSGPSFLYFVISRLEVVSSYGINAMREAGHGGFNLAMLFQFNFGKTSFASDRAYDRLSGARAPAQ